MHNKALDIIATKLKIDVRQNIKSIFWLVSGYGLQVFSGLILTVAFANLLDKASYGTFQFIIAVGVVLSAISLSGMATAVKRSTARGNEGALRYGFQVKLLWGITTVILSAAVATYFFSIGDYLLAKGFILFGLLMPWADAYSLYKAYLTGSQRFKESSFLGLWRRPITTAAVITSLLLTNDVLIILSTYLISNLISVGLLYRLVVKKYDLPITKDGTILNYSKHQSILGAIATAGNNSDKIIIYMMLGPVNMAIYLIATLPANQGLKLFGLILSDLLFSKFTKQSLNEITGGLTLKATLLMAVSLVTVIGYVFTAEQIFKIIFPLYPEAVILSQIAMLALLTKFNGLFNLFFMAKDLKKVQYFLMLSSNILKVILLLLVIPFYGLLGAVWTLVGVHLFRTIILLIYFFYYRYQKLHPQSN